MTSRSEAVRLGDEAVRSQLLLCQLGEHARPATVAFGHLTVAMHCGYCGQHYELPWWRWRELYRPTGQLKLALEDF